MIKKRTIVFGAVAAVLALAPSKADAQVIAGAEAGRAQGGVSLTLQQAQEYALAHNNTLKNASIDIQKAEASKWQVISSMLPQVSASGDYSNYFGYTMDFGAMSIAMPPYVSLGITTAVGFGGAQVVSLQVSDISKKMSNISLQKSEQEICDQVKVLYYSALVTEESLKLLEENQASMQKLYDISKKSVEVGVSEQTDADQLLVQVTTMDNTIQSTRRSLEMVYNSLRLQLNLDPSTQITLLQDLDNLVNEESARDLMQEKFDINNNYSYQLLKRSTELARKQIAMTGWSNGPTLSVYHQYTTKKYFSDEMRMDMTPPNMLGIKLSMPIFTSGKTYFAIKDAKLAYQKQLNTLQDTELALKVQFSQLQYNLRSAIERLDTQRQNAEVARRVFDNIAKKYEYGVASSLDVTNSGTSLISAQSSYVQALLDMVNAQISLEQLLNK